MLWCQLSSEDLGECPPFKILIDMNIFESCSGLLPETPALTEISFSEVFSGSGKSLPFAPQEKGALTEMHSSGIIFRALAGISGKSPRVLTQENCYRDVHQFVRKAS